MRSSLSLYAYFFFLPHFPTSKQQYFTTSFNQSFSFSASSNSRSIILHYLLILVSVFGGVLLYSLCKFQAPRPIDMANMGAKESGMNFAFIFLAFSLISGSSQLLESMLRCKPLVCTRYWMKNVWC